MTTETTNPRQQRGLIIAATCKLTKKERCWLVPSQTGQGQYYVHINKAEPSCTCPDHQESGHKCKHIFAAEIVFQRELFPDGTEVETKTVTMTETVVRKTYPQQWTAYNAAQTNEKDHFQTMLRDLCKQLAQPAKYSSKGGRPSIPAEDALFSAIFKVYSTLSGRRFMSDLRDAKEKGHVDRMPSYNSIFRILERKSTTAILHAMITLTAAPLKAVETTFAMDSSGFSACRFDRWFDHKWGGMKSKRTWVKCHLACGVKTNIVSAVIMSDAGDCPQLPALLATTRQTFNVKEVCADMAYASTDNFCAIEGGDAKGFIPFKSSITGAIGGIFEKAFHYFKLHREEFDARYHQRSNVESTFSMVKAKFGDSVGPRPIPRWRMKCWRKLSAIISAC